MSGTKRKYFGTDGIRGRVGVGAITPERVLKLGWAAGRVFANGSNDAKVVIGKDTRVSGYMLESALEAGLSAAGVDVSLIGPMPTPGIAYLTRTARASAGIVISASHNPYHDNGIKFFSEHGSKLDDQIEIEIENMMDLPLETVESNQLGKATRFSDAAGRYIEFCKNTFPAQLDLKGLKLVIDSANGAAYHIAPHVFEELGAQVISIGNKPNGFNINEQCGSTQPECLTHAVITHQADVGIALDGDGDRVIMSTKEGEILDGDQLLYAMIKHRLNTNTLQGGLVGTLMTNIGLEIACRELGVDFVRAKVGDRYVLQRLVEKDWVLGGESSGHIICLDKTSTGDGIVAALEVLSCMVESKKSLSAVVSGLVKYPQIMKNIALKAGSPSAEDVLADEKVCNAVSQVQQLLAGEGRVVMRASGTEPLIRAMVEGPDAALVEQYAGEIAMAVENTCQL